MKDSVLSQEEYEKVKNFYTLMKLSNLGELNQIYNFQDTVILCQIFEQRSDQIYYKKYSSLTPENVIVPAVFLVVSIEIEVNVVLPYLQTQSMLEHLKKNYCWVQL